MSAGRGTSLIRSASLMGGLTMLSRVLGYARDSLNAALFGAGAVADAYFVAFRIPNMLRDLVGEGALSAAVVPVVARLDAAGRKPASLRLITSLLTLTVAGGAVVVAAGWLAAPVVVAVMAPGFSASPAKFALTVSLTRWLFPFIAFIALAAVLMGLLNARRRFGPPAFAPIALNGCVVAGGLALCPLLGPAPERQILGWTAAVLLGGMAQWLVQLPAARREGLEVRARWTDPALGEVGRLMLPAVIGLSVTQAHLLVNTILASLLPEGSVARLYYGNRLMQLPLGVIGVALSTAAYPVVARALADGRPSRATEAVNHALRLAAFAILPAAAGLIALAPWITGLLFRFGRFGEEDAAAAAAVSSAYALGIIGHACTRVLTPPFYALGRPYQPVGIAAAGVAANALLSAALMSRLGIVGLPLATSLVTLATAWWLGARLQTLVPGVGAGGVGGTFVRSLAAAGVMGLAVRAAASFGADRLAALGTGDKTAEALLTGGGIALGVALYAALARLFDLRELRDVLGALRRRSA